MATPWTQFACLVVCFGVSAFARSTAEHIDSKDPRARPVVYVLLAAVDSDIDLFKFAFSSEVRRQIETSEDQWSDGLKAWHDGFRTSESDYTMGEISSIPFQFSGSDDSGEIKLVNRKGELVGPIPVVKEDGSWKINEK